MTRLSHLKLKQVQDCIREIYSNQDIESLPAHIIASIARVIPSTIAAYNYVDPIKQKVVNSETPVACFTPELLSRFEEFMHEHPYIHLLSLQNMEPHMFRRQFAARPKIYRKFLGGEAVKISDAVSQGRFQNSGLYHEFFRNVNVKYQMVITGRSPAEGLTFNRDRRDHTEEERLALDLLAPHVRQALKNADAFAAMEWRLEAANAIINAIIFGMNGGMIGLGKNLRIGFFSGGAERLLRDHFGRAGRSKIRLPDELERWCKRQPSLQVQDSDILSPEKPFIKENGNRLLTIRLVADSGPDGREHFLLLREESIPSFTERMIYLGLTKRESDVLYWITQGKSNKETAATLNIAAGTIKVHLESIYRKLGVDNRTAAALKALQMPGQGRRL